MKVANKAPQAMKSPVRVTDSKYQLWYARPVNLGEINRIGNYWYTNDGMRFMSGRNALDYLAKIRELVEMEMGVDSKYFEKIKAKESSSPKLVKSQPKRRAGANKQIDREAFEKFLLSMGYTKNELKDSTQ